MSFARAKRRDANECAVVDALEAIGASVTRLDGDGIPDLLVGYRGHTWLFEVKNPKATGGAKRGGERTKGHGALTPAQVDWHASWRGKAPVIVTTASEAIAAVAARGDGDRSSEGTPERLVEASQQAVMRQGGVR